MQQLKLQMKGNNQQLGSVLKKWLRCLHCNTSFNINYIFVKFYNKAIGLKRGTQSVRFHGPQPCLAEVCEILPDLPALSAQSMLVSWVSMLLGWYRLRPGSDAVLHLSRIEFEFRPT